eukprot:14211766-Alexandrium_andersonii.AAC.1
MEAIPMPSAARLATPANSAAPELSASLLRGGPTLDRARTARADTPTRGPPSAEAPSEVIVHKGADLSLIHI